MKKQYFLKLLSKKLSGELAVGKEQQLQQAIEENGEYQQIADTLTLYFQNKYEIQSAPDDKLKEAWERITEDRNVNDLYNTGDQSRVRGRFTLQNLSKVAAILILIFAGIATWHFFNQKQAVVFTTLTATDGKIFKTLNDGTRVWLREGSVLTYNEDFGKAKREMSLKGEAFFDVAKNKSIPLFIHAGNIDIEVKGTSFNVIADQKYPGIEVSLLRGLVEVTDHLDKSHKVLLKPMQKLIFLPGESNNNNPFSIVSLSPNVQLQETKWTIDSLIFKKERLMDLAIQLERKYQVKIEIQDEKLKNKRFSGVLKDELLTEALDALKLSYPFSYTINNSLVIIK
jgi:ferric-dicitrate binding protein FerR (iron transport regulator)